MRETERERESVCERETDKLREIFFFGGGGGTERDRLR